MSISTPQYLWVAPFFCPKEEAYRRDRRKDALLQEHGYFVLRFLVEDVGKRLDHVLDAIQRVLTLLDRESEHRK